MDSKVNCICQILEEIYGFQSFLEFDRFLKYIDGLEKDADLEEINVRKYYSGFKEQWYQCTKCGEIWRLVFPDFPFQGLWKKVKC